jgi:hypothetical protein
VYHQAGAVGVAERMAAEQEIERSPPVAADGKVRKFAGVRAQRIEVAMLSARRIPVYARGLEAGRDGSARPEAGFGLNSNVRNGSKAVMAGMGGKQTRRRLNFVDVVGSG